MGWREQLQHRQDVIKRQQNKASAWIFTGVATGAASIVVAWELHYRNATELRKIPSTDQVQRSNSLSDGQKIESKGGADEQGKKWKFWDDDDDDTDPTGSAPNESIRPTKELIDPDFDAYQVGAALAIAVLVVYAIAQATRNSSNRAVVV